MTAGNILGTAVLELAADYERMEQDMMAAQNLVEGRMASMAQSAMGLGQTLSLSVTAPIAAVGTAAFLAGSEWEAATIEMQKATGAAGDELAGLERDMQQIIMSIPQGFDTAAAIVGELNTRLDLTGEALQEVGIQSADFLRVNNLQEESIGNLGRMFNALELDIESIPFMLDKLTLAGQLSGISVDRLMQLVVEAGPAFEELGFDVDRTIALFSQFEKVGARPEEVLSSMTQALNTLADEGFTNAEEGFNEYLRRIEEAPNILEATAIANELFGRRVGAKVAEDIRAGRFEVDEWVEALENAEGVLSETADATLSFGDQFDILKNQVSLALAPIGLDLMHVLLRVVEPLRDVVTAMMGLSDSTRRVITVIALIAATIGPALMMFGRFASVLAAVASPVGAIALGITLLAIAIQQNVLGIRDFIENILDALIGRVGNVTDAIESFREAFSGDWVDASGIMPLHRVFGHLGTMLRDVLAALRDGDWAAAFEAIGTGLRNVGLVIAEFALSLFDDFVQVLRGLDWAAIGLTILQLLGGGLTIAARTIGTVLTIGAVIFGAIVEQIRNITWSEVGDALTAGLGLAMEGLSFVADAATDLAESIRNWLVGLVGQVEWGDVWAAMLAGLSAAGQGISWIVTTTIDLAGALLLWVYDRLSNIEWENVWDSIIAGFNAAGRGIAWVILATVNLAKAIYDWFDDLLEDVTWEDLWNLFTTALNAGWTGLVFVLTAVVDLAVGIYEWFDDLLEQVTWESVWAILLNSLNDAWTGLKFVFTATVDLAGDVIEWFQDLIKDIEWGEVWDSIRDGFDKAVTGVEWLVDQTSDLGDRIRDWVTDETGGIEWSGVVDKIWERFTATLTDMKNATILAVGIAEVVLDWLTEELGEIDVEGIVDSLLESLGAAWDLAVQVGADIHSWLVNGLNEVQWGDLGRQLGENLTEAFQATQGLSDWLQDMFDDIDWLGLATAFVSRWFDNLREAGNAAQQFEDWLWSWFDEFDWYALGVLFGQGLTLAIRATELAGELLIDLFLGMFQKSEEDSDNLALAIGSLLAKAFMAVVMSPMIITQWLSDMIMDAKWDSIADLVSLMLGSALDFTKGFAEGFEPLADLIADVEGAIDSLRETLDNIRDHVDGWRESLIGFFLNLREEIADKTMSEMIEALIGWFGELPARSLAYVEELYDGVIEWFANLYDDTIGAVAEMVDGIVEWFSELPGRVMEWVDEFIGDVVRAVVDFALDMLGYAEDITINFIAGLLSPLDEVTSAAATIIETFLEGFGDPVSILVQLGKDMLNGLLSGLTDNVLLNSIRKAGEVAADLVPDVIKNRWASESPSRVAIDLVGDFIDGMLIGFDDGELDLAQRAASVAQSVVNAMSSALDLMERLSETPTIATWNESLQTSLVELIDGAARIVKDFSDRWDIEVLEEMSAAASLVRNMFGPLNEALTFMERIADAGAFTEWTDTLHWSFVTMINGVVKVFDWFREHWNSDVLAEVQSTSELLKGLFTPLTDTLEFLNAMQARNFDQFITWTDTLKWQFVNILNGVLQVFDWVRQHWDADVLNAVQDTAGRFGGMLDPLGAAMDLVDQLQDNPISEGDAWSETLKWRFVQLLNGIVTVFDWFREHWDSDVLAGVQNSANRLGGLFEPMTAALEFAESLQDSTFAQFERWTAGLRTAFVGILTDVTESLIDIRSSLGQETLAAADSAAESLTGIFAPFQRAIEFLGQIQDITMSDFDAWTAELRSRLTSITADVLESMHEFATEWDIDVLEAAASAASAIQAVFGPFNDAIEFLARIQTIKLGDFKKWTVDLRSNLENLTRDVFTSMDEFATTWDIDVYERASNAASAMRGLFGPFTDSLEFLERLQDVKMSDFTRWTDDLAMSMSEMLDRVVQVFLDMESTHDTAALDQIEIAIPPLSEMFGPLWNMFEFLDRYTSTNLRRHRNIGSQLSENIRPIFESIVDLFTELNEDYASEMLDELATLGRSMDQMLGELVGVLEKMQEIKIMEKDLGLGRGGSGGLSRLADDLGGLFAGHGDLSISNDSTINVHVEPEIWVQMGEGEFEAEVIRINNRWFEDWRD